MQSYKCLERLVPSRYLSSFFLLAAIFSLSSKAEASSLQVAKTAIASTVLNVTVSTNVRRISASDESRWKLLDALSLPRFSGQ